VLAVETSDIGEPSDAGKVLFCGVDGLSKLSSSLAITIMVRVEPEEEEVTYITELSGVMVQS
jgi:hypothetical protein